MYSKITDSIRVTVETQFLEDQSESDEDHYVWAYHVSIENLGLMSVQLKTRHWEITDGNGQVHKVYGDGVVGEQPTLDAGDIFEYTSGVPLTTPSGIMTGYYQMTTDLGDNIQVDIPAFSLDSPYDLKSIH
jgi:ApaG protein